MPKTPSPYRHPWQTWYCVLLGLAWNVLLFIFLCTTFAEKHKQGLLVTAGVFGISLIGYAVFLRLLKGERLRTPAARRVMFWGSLGLTLFVGFLFVPFAPPAALDTRAVEPVTRLDSRDQAGSALYAKAEGLLPGDEITLTIFDICLGGIQNKARRDGPVSPEKLEITDNALLTEFVKDEARSLGAGLVGVAKLDEAYVFTADHQGNPIRLPHTYAIVMGVDLPYNLALPSAPLPWQDLYSTLPEELAAMMAGMVPRHGADMISPKELEDLKETMRFFSEGGRSAVELARFIRSLGFEARAHYSRWSEVQIIPLAEAAGLGELARNGLLLTKKYGPRASFSVVTTTMPLVADERVDLGLRAFCASCDKCALACPVKALPLGGPKLDRGTYRWIADGERCYQYLLANPKCMACLGSCPFNKPDFMLHRLATFMGTRNNAVTNRLLLALDNLLGYGHVPTYMPDIAEVSQNEPPLSGAVAGSGTAPTRE